MIRYFIPFLLLSSSLFGALSFEEPWGKDCDLRVPPPPQKEVELSIATRIADYVIKFHQQVISPVDGPRSHYRPSSSRYMQLAMYRYGFWKGFLMGCDRLLRENDELWVYRTIEVNGEVFKYDPACLDKSEGLRD